MNFVIALFGIKNFLRKHMFSRATMSFELDVAYHAIVKYFMYMYRKLPQIGISPIETAMQRYYQVIVHELSDN